MHQPDKQEGPSMRIKSGMFQATPLASDQEKEQFVVSTARKHSIEAKGMCSICGIRVARDDLEACSHCGSPLCVDCKRQSQKKGKRLAAAR